MKQGLEDANTKLNALIDHLSPPTTMQGSATGLGTASSTQVTLSAPSNSGSLQPAPSVVTASTRCPPHASQPNEPAWITTSFHSIPALPPTLPQPHVRHHPTCMITLVGRLELFFTKNDVPHVPSISFTNNLDTLNSMWDDTSAYWKGHSVLVIQNFPIAITYWKQLYTLKSRKNWKPGQWKILKGRYFEWRVSTRSPLSLSTLDSSLFRCSSKDTAAEPQRSFGAPS